MKIASLYDQIEYNEQKPSVNVLIDNNNTKEIRIVFRQGQEMKEHKTKFPIVVEIVEGSIDFGVENERHQLSKGEIIALDGDIPHDLKAEVDSIVRLSLSKSDQTGRVEKLVNG